MKKYSLTATTRNLVGRKVKQLRAQGQIPATIYGKNVPSISITTDKKAFESLYSQAGETGLIELAVDKDTRPVLVHNVQRHPMDEALLHIEFHQVDLKEKVHAMVPVEMTGESLVVTDRKGVLLTVLDEIEVEALPTDLPEKILLDVSVLAEVGQELTVGSVKPPANVTILTDPKLILVRADALVSKEAEQQAEADAAQAAAAATEETTGKEESAAPAGESAPAPTGEEKKEEK